MRLITALLISALAVNTAHAKIEQVRQPYKLRAINQCMLDSAVRDIFVLETRGNVVVVAQYTTVQTDHLAAVVNYALRMCRVRVATGAYKLKLH